MLLRLRFIQPAQCCGHAFQPGDELATDTEDPSVFYCIHRLAPVWAEVVKLGNSGIVEHAGPPLTADAVIKMVERRLAPVKTTTRFPQTG